MSEPSFDIAFYGIIQPGKDKESVIRNMAALFKTTPEKVRPFFAGGRKVIKSAVDELTAEKERLEDLIAEREMSDAKAQDTSKSA